MASPDAPSEDESQRNGVLSYAAEWHAISHGIFFGLTTKPWAPPPVIADLTGRAYKDTRKEPQYYRGGYVLGTLLQLAILVVSGIGLHALAAGGGI